LLLHYIQVLCQYRLCKAEHSHLTYLMLKRHFFASRVCCRENVFTSRSLPTAISSGSTILVSAFISQRRHIQVYSSSLNLLIHDLLMTPSQGQTMQCRVAGRLANGELGRIKKEAVAYKFEVMYWNSSERTENMNPHIL
jgi:hypothetical protein